MPNEWIEAKLSDIAEKGYGIVDGPFGSYLKTSDYIDDKINGVPVLTTKNLEGNYSDEKVRFVSKEKFEQLKRSAVKPYDILVAKIGSIGKNGIYPKGYRIALIPANLLKISVNTSIELMYVYYYINSHKFQQMLKKITTATAQPAFNVTKFRNLPIPLPPRPEQERIVAKIEELFSELDKGVENLQTIKQQLKVYRQAVLKDAFEGKLNEQISIEKPRMTILANIVDDIRTGPFGTMLHEHEYIQNGIPVINPKHIKNQEIIHSEKVTILQSKADELKSYWLQENDVIFGRRGEMGRCAPVTPKEVDWLCGTGSMIFRFKKSFNTKLYSMILSGQNVVQYLEENCTGTTMKNLNEKIVKNIPVPLFTELEQERLMNAIESRLSVCDKIEQTVEQTLLKTESLRQGILKKAFEGKLVEQNFDEGTEIKLSNHINEVGK